MVTMSEDSSAAKHGVERRGTPAATQPTVAATWGSAGSSSLGSWFSSRSTRPALAIFCPLGAAWCCDSGPFRRSDVRAEATV